MFFKHVSSVTSAYSPKSAGSQPTTGLRRVLYDLTFSKTRDEIFSDAFYVVSYRLLVKQLFSKCVIQTFSFFASVNDTKKYRTQFHVGKKATQVTLNKYFLMYKATMDNPPLEADNYIYLILG